MGYVFGGERSAYEYPDLWKYEFSTSTWEYQAITNSAADLARHDHTAVVYGDHMFVYGGRSPQPRGDMWAYSFKDKTWTAQPSSSGMRGRFGHSAAISGGVMYVFGGYVAGVGGAEGALTDEIWSYAFETQTWTQVGPRYDNFFSSWNEDPTEAIIFPMDTPAPRFGHIMLATGEMPALYVMGG